MEVEPRSRQRPRDRHPELRSHIRRPTDSKKSGACGRSSHRPSGTRLNPSRGARANYVDPTLTAAVTTALYISKTADPSTVVKDIKAVLAATATGDLSNAEAMLAAHVVALNAIFFRLAGQAHDAKSIQHQQILTQLALRAQAAARTSIEALFENKNPRQVAFIRQTNVAQTQQVNNTAASPARAIKTKKAPNKLKALEAQDGSTTLDIGSTPRTGRAHPRDPALASRHRADKPSR